MQLKKRTLLFATFFVGCFLVLASGVVFSRRFRQFAPIKVDEKVYEVVLARTPQEIELGLSYRSEIGADGMLFLLPTKDTPIFWMYQMKLPLDFIWIDGETIVGLNENVPFPAPGVPDSSISRVQPDVPVTAVLEVPAGFIQRESIKIGTQVTQVTEFSSRVW